MHLMERKMGVGTGGRGHGGRFGECGQLSSLLLSFFLYSKAGGEGWQTFVLGTFSRIGSLYWMRGAGGCALCVRGPTGAAVGEGSVKTPKICSNSRFHNGVKWSEEMSAWPWHCTVTWGPLNSRTSHTHTQDWLSFSKMFFSKYSREAHSIWVEQKLNSAELWLQVFRIHLRNYFIDYSVILF